MTIIKELYAMISGTSINIREKYPPNVLYCTTNKRKVYREVLLADDSYRVYKIIKEVEYNDVDKVDIQTDGQIEI